MFCHLYSHAVVSTFSFQNLSLLGNLLNLWSKQSNTAYQWKWHIPKGLEKTQSIIFNFCSCQVSDLEPVLAMLERQDPKSTETWETRYSLLLWLSIIVKIPFHMTRLDSFQVLPGPSSASDGENMGRKTVIQR